MKLRWLLALGLAVVLAGPAFGQEAAPADTALASPPAAAIAAPAPPVNVRAVDKPNDHGHAVVLTWDLSADDGGGAGSVLGYEMYRWVPYLVDTLATIRTAAEAVRTQIAEGGGGLGHRRDSLREAYLETVDRLRAAYAGYPAGGEFRTWDGAVAPAGTRTFTHTGNKDEWDDAFVPDHTDFYYRVDAVTADPLVRASSAVVGPVQSAGQWFNTGKVAVLIAVLLFGALIVILVDRARRGADLYVRPLAGIEA
ncbi:MAG TPA: hypothetical protein PLR32_06400, partial [candidate division Zixibacteria bacterium]|nr:hypothetical protein [candidate division Zixibacteria bacterium]